MFKEAEEIAQKHPEISMNGGEMQIELLIKRAQSEETNGNLKEAAKLYTKAKKYRNAIDIYGEKGILDSLLQICKVLDATKNIEEIKLCAKFFKEHEHHTYASQALLKLNDQKGLMVLHVEMHKWEEAIALVKKHPEFADMLYLPYADFLSSNDQFEEAQAAYKKANRPDLSIRIIEFLTKNAVVEKRFLDAGQYYYIMATEYLKQVENVERQTLKDKANIKKFD